MCSHKKSEICSPKSDDSLSESHDDKTPKRLLHRTTSEGRRAKVVRKSRKSRQLRVSWLYSKHASIGVQTDEGMTAKPLVSHNDNFVSCGTQTDDVIVINVPAQLHASSTMSDGLFSFGHSGRFFAIRVSDAHSTSFDRDTDSGHMSDIDNKPLSAAESTDHDSEKPNEVQKPLATPLPHRGSGELNGATVGRDLSEYDQRQCSKTAAVKNNTLAVVSQKLSSPEHCSQMSRWTTATRLDVLEETDEGRINEHRRTFLAQLDMSDHHPMSSNDIDMSGISVLSNHRASNLPLPSSKLLSVNGQTRSSTAVHSSVVLSNGSASQSLAGAQCHVLNVTSQPTITTRLSNSTNGSASRPSAGSRHHVSKGLSHSKPRLSVGRKSLSRRKSAGLRDKSQLSATKMSRPAAWLMSATKSSRSKVLVP